MLGVNVARYRLIAYCLGGFFTATAGVIYGYQVSFITPEIAFSARAPTRYFIYIPTELARDSQFPFKDGEEVLISLKAKKAIEISKSH